MRRREETNRNATIGKINSLAQDYSARSREDLIIIFNEAVLYGQSDYLCSTLIKNPEVLQDVLMKCGRDILELKLGTENSNLSQGILSSLFNNEAKDISSKNKQLLGDIFLSYKELFFNEDNIQFAVKGCKSTESIGRAYEILIKNINLLDDQAKIGMLKAFYTHSPERFASILPYCSAESLLEAKPPEHLIRKDQKYLTMLEKLGHDMKSSMGSEDRLSGDRDAAEAKFFAMIHKIGAEKVSARHRNNQTIQQSCTEVTKTNNIKQNIHTI